MSVFALFVDTRRTHYCEFCCQALREIMKLLWNKFPLKEQQKSPGERLAKYDLFHISIWEKASGKHLKMGRPIQKKLESDWTNIPIYDIQSRSDFFTAS